MTTDMADLFLAAAAMPLVRRKSGIYAYLAGDIFCEPPREQFLSQWPSRARRGRRAAPPSAGRRMPTAYSQFDGHVLCHALRNGRECRAKFD